MPQAGSRWLLNAEAGSRSQASPCEVCGGQNDTGTGFSLQVLQFFPCQCYSINSPYSYQSTFGSYQKDKRARPGNLTKSYALSEILRGR
jgi:hypothetical protein